ncbi:hypothetical protein C5D34_12130 [Rathayibacter sp. AY1B1]|uniref:hypothetical protein n=1 Tax=unclassified Rathayibacter TaxID=2609250 RepID=UPI000CE7B50B|nr:MULTISPECIES: hypothetical protein [unclassified Rathayibacter]PPI19058.1 hypothetical protein C5D08_15045 [Rathayibacter sp. AY1B6]PPI31342.1 hypothetical protein C5D34_12130 [Rathayibacter sp. AY1B1]
MTSLPDAYVDSMPTDPDLLMELGRVAWAAARLHAGVRDAIGRHLGASTDEPFTKTLGQAISQLETLARLARRTDQLDWITDVGRPAKDKRNAVIHAVTYTATDGRQAITTSDGSAPGRFLNPELRAVTLELIEAHTDLPL